MPKTKRVSPSVTHAASRGDLPADELYDQYDTSEPVVTLCLNILREHCKLDDMLMVDPSAGAGAFFNRFPSGSLGYEIDRTCEGVIAADFFDVTLESDRSIAVVGNPPFGPNGNLALDFLNHAAKQADVVAMILPRSFRKNSVQNKIETNFRLLRDEDLPRNAFIFREAQYDVQTIFQIWVRCREPRKMHRLERRHPDFEFTTADRADFAIRRIGARAGLIHHDLLTANPGSHYFIAGDVEAVMAQLDLKSVASNVASIPSLSKAEIVALYDAFLQQSPPTSKAPTMSKPRVERALGYVRVSTQRQAEGGISLDNQEERLAAHYAQRGIELVDIYRDGGFSGTTENRPGFQALVEHSMRPGAGITEIGVYSFSRLFRDHYLLEHYRRKLKRAGIRIVAITQEVGQDAEGDLVRSVLSNFDEYQSRQTAKFTRDTMRRNAEAGFWNGAIPPFGYTTEVAEMRGPKAKKRLVIEPSEALMVQQIFRMKRVGIGSGPMGYKKIVCHLNASGTTLRGRKWHVSNVRDILTRSTYRGKHLYGVHDTRNGIKRPEEEWQEVDAPIIISETEWLEVQAGIARNARHVTPARIVASPTMLAGIAKCGHPGCGHALTIATGKGGRYRYYRCSRNLRRGETACQGTSIRDEKLETIVIDAIAERLLRPERLQLLLANLLDDSSAAVRERQAHLKALRTERTRVEGAIQNMFDFIEQGVVSPRDADFTARLAAQRTRRADLEQEILLVERQLSTVDRRVTPEAIGRLGEVILTKLRSDDPTARQGYARRFIARVVVAPQRITITGPIKPLEMAANGVPDQQAPMVPPIDREWCRVQDSNMFFQKHRARLPLQPEHCCTREPPLS
jgi:site-specific DNA recombinase